MQYQTKDLADGKHNGETVWICHYNQPDLDKKALRNVPPTKCLIRSIDDLPPNKTVYYSLSYFAPLKASGQPSSKIVGLVDNTGFRGRSGNALFVFDSEEECVKEWNSQLVDHCNKLQNKIDNAAEYWRNKQIELEKSMV